MTIEIQQKQIDRLWKQIELTMTKKQVSLVIELEQRLQLMEHLRNRNYRTVKDGE